MAWCSTRSGRGWVRHGCMKGFIYPQASSSCCSNCAAGRFFGKPSQQLFGNTWFWEVLGFPRRIFTSERATPCELLGLDGLGHHPTPEEGTGQVDIISNMGWRSVDPPNQIFKVCKEGPSMHSMHVYMLSRSRAHEFWAHFQHQYNLKLCMVALPPSPNRM